MAGSTRPRFRGRAGWPRSSAASTGSSAPTPSASRTGRATRRACSSSCPLLRRAVRAAAPAGAPVPQPRQPPAVPSHIALNTTASFVTNTNWQYYGGEYTMSYLSQMAGLAVQKFVSAAVGMAVLVAVIRGLRPPLARRARQLLGRPLPLARLHPAPARADPRVDPRLAGRRRRPSRARDRDDARGRDADDRPRPGRVA